MGARPIDENRSLRGRAALELSRGETLSWALLLLGSAAVLVAYHWGFAPPRSAGDYAQYLLHAQAIAGGRPYGDTGYIFSPLSWSTGPELLPPLWPVVLAPLVGAFGVLSVAPRVATLLCLLVFAALASRFLGRREGWWVAVPVAGFLIVSLEDSYALTVPISDMLFGALFWATIWVGHEEREWTWPRIVLLVGLAGLTIATRVAGVVFVPALVLAALFRSPRERRRGVVLGALLLAAALVVVLTIPERVPFLSRVTIDADQLNRMLLIALRYRVAFAGATLYPSTISAFNDAWHLAAILLFVVGMLTMARRYAKGLLGATALCYGGMLLVAPVYDGRYVWPLFPVIIAAVAVGLRRVVAWVPAWSGHASRATVAVLGMVLLGAALTTARREPPESLVDQPEAGEVFAWLRQHADSTSTRVVFLNPRVLTLYTGVPAMSTFGGYNRERMLAEVERQGITHFVLDLTNNDLQPRDFVAAMASLSPPWVSRYENARYRVLQRPDPAAATTEPSVPSRGS